MVRFLPKFRKERGNSKPLDKRIPRLGLTGWRRQQTTWVPFQSVRKVSESDPPESVDTNENIAIVEAFIRAHSVNHTGSSLASLASKNCLVKFIDDGVRIEIPICQYVDIIASLWSSFPDFKLHFGRITYSIVDDSVIAENLRASGTHTGAPYAFGPYLPVDANGTRVTEPPGTSFHFRVRSGKVCHMVPQGYPQKSGPGYFYAAIGGDIF